MKINKIIFAALFISTSTFCFADAPVTATNYTTSNGIIYQANIPITLHGISWFGMETTTHAVHGLWSGRSIEDFLNQMKQLGFNALRVPVEPGIFDSNNKVTGDGATYEGMSAPDFLKTFLDATQKANVYVLLDYHRNNPNGQSEGPDKSVWMPTLIKLATLSKNYPNIIGIDLFNEPHGSTTPEQWIEDSNDAYSQLNSINPNLLFWVEGIGYGDGNPHWGENISILTTSTTKITIPKNKLVFSPHTYGPDVAPEPYFNDATFPTNMPVIWDSFFGNLVNQGYTICTGEFGSRYDNSQEKAWFSAFTDYLANSKPMSSCWFFWALNPNSGDTGGILQDDWKTVNTDKLAILSKIMKT